MKKHKLQVCCVFNIAPLYREAIYTLLDRDDELSVDFYFGDRDASGIELMDATRFRGFHRYLENRYRGTKLIWQKGWRDVFRKNYDAYILTSNPGIRSNWLIVLWARLRGKKVYLWGPGIRFGGDTLLERIQYKVYFALAGRILLYGDRVKRLLVRRGFDPERIWVVYNSLDYERQLRLRESEQRTHLLEDHFGNDLPVITFVSRFTPQKRVPELIGAIAELLRRGVGCNLLLVGGGEETEALKKLVQEKGIAEHVLFYGPCYDPETIACLWKESMLCLCPGQTGLLAMQAMMYGRPVITHDNVSFQGEEVEAILPGRTGDFFREGDLDDLCGRTAEWLARLNDPAERERVAEACYEVIDSRYNPEKQLAVIKAALKS